MDAHPRVNVVFILVMRGLCVDANAMKAFSGLNGGEYHVLRVILPIQKASEIHKECFRDDG